MRRAVRLTRPVNPLSFMARCVVVGAATVALAAPVLAGLLPVPTGAALSCCQDGDETVLH